MPGRQTVSRHRPAATTDPARKLRFRTAVTELAQLDKSDLDAALRRILRVDADTLDVARVSFWELAPDHSLIKCRIMYCQNSDAFSEGAELRAADFPAHFAALLENRQIVVDDAWNDPRTRAFAEPYLRPNGITSMLDVPVWRRGKLAGVVCREQVGPIRAWATDEQDFALGVGNMVSAALESHDRRWAEEGSAMVARATNDVLWDWNLTTNQVVWNEAVFSVFRFEPKDVAGTPQWWIDHIHRHDRARVTAAVHAAIDSGQTTWNDQYRWLRGDGSVATVLDRGFIARGEQGQATRMVGSMVDISDRVEMQTRLAQSDRMASIGTLAAGVAHEINNPLTYISANLTCLAESCRQGRLDPAEVLELVREALDGTDRVRRIVRDLQTFSRPREDDVEAIDAHTVIDSSINMAWNEIRHRAQLVKEYGALPRVNANRARLGQVVLNLLINAAQAIPEGNVNCNQIAVRTTTDSAGNAVIEISDTGTGIPAESASTSSSRSSPPSRLARAPVWACPSATRS